MRSSRLLKLFAGIFILVGSASSYAEAWQWKVTPYVWGVSPELNLGVVIPPDDNQAGTEAAFSDLLDKLDFAGQVHIEAQKDDFGFLLDLTNLQLSDRTTQGLLEVDTDSSTSLIEGAMLFRISEGTSRTDLLFGFRTLMLDVDIEIEGLGPQGNVIEKSTDTTLTDVMAGARFNTPLSERWNFSVRGDVATGDTDFSWNVSAVFGYRFPSAGTVLFGYRYLDVDFDNEGRFTDPELIIQGPQIGYSFHF